MSAIEKFPRKLFNKGQRRIDYSRDKEVDGVIVKENFSLSPQTAAPFTDEEAAYLLKLFKTELIDMNNVTVESLTDAHMQNKMAEQSRAQDEEIAKRLADAKHLKAVKAFEEAVAEGFSEAEAKQIAGLPADFVAPKKAEPEAPNGDDKAEGGEGV